MLHPCVCIRISACALASDPGASGIMWFHNPASRPNSASPPNALSPIRRHHLMQRQQFGVTTYLMWLQQFDVTTQCGFTIPRRHPIWRQETIRRHDPIRRQGTIWRQTTWRHNSASPYRAMRLQEFGFGVKSFATLPHAAALYICVYRYVYIMYNIYI